MFSFTTNASPQFPIRKPLPALKAHVPAAFAAPLGMEIPSISFILSQTIWRTDIQWGEISGPQMCKYHNLLVMILAHFVQQDNPAHITFQIFLSLNTNARSKKLSNYTVAAWFQSHHEFQPLPSFNLILIWFSRLSLLQKLFLLV